MAKNNALEIVLCGDMVSVVAVTEAEEAAAVAAEATLMVLVVSFDFGKKWRKN